VDLAEPLGPARLVGAAGDRIDILVNNVGRADVRTGGFLSVTDEQWQASIDLNLLPAVRATRSTLPMMLAAGRGSIVNIASVNTTLSIRRSSTTAQPRRRWPASPKRCPKRWVPTASGSTPSAPARRDPDVARR